MKKPFFGRPKYRNKKVIVDGVTFDSRKEYERWVTLLGMQEAGHIRDLQRQVTFRIEVRGKLICRYRADAVYRDADTNERIIEDTKSPITRKEPAYRIKAKLMAAIHGKITEV